MLTRYHPFSPDAPGRSVGDAMDAASTLTGDEPGQVYLPSAFGWRLRRDFRRAFRARLSPTRARWAVYLRLLVSIIAFGDDIMPQG